MYILSNFAHSKTDLLTIVYTNKKLWVHKKEIYAGIRLDIKIVGMKIFHAAAMVREIEGFLKAQFIQKYSVVKKTPHDPT